MWVCLQLCVSGCVPWLQLTCTLTHPKATPMLCSYYLPAATTLYIPQAKPKPYLPVFVWVCPQPCVSGCVLWL